MDSKIFKTVFFIVVLSLEDVALFILGKHSESLGWTKIIVLAIGIFGMSYLFAHISKKMFNEKIKEARKIIIGKKSIAVRIKKSIGAI